MSKKPAPKTDPPTTDRLRADIDSGKTHDKVRYSDPAAAPLGSDDEAAGNPPSPRERHLEAQNRSLGHAPSRRDSGAFWAYGLMIVGAALVVLAVGLFVIF
ncbi:hypothetical protein [Chelativorans sp. YIM 93263]|uniref:hypothetical protein n=1 Tax=Chelativorans sp. YIM 93263 TaxID=2906648 RepID=UPI0023797D88|nr:hypothetical protein [Chelativorans sp. YIM 93263]